MKAFYVVIKTSETVKGYFIVAESLESAYQLMLETHEKLQLLPRDNVECYEIDPGKAHSVGQGTYGGYLN